MEKSINEIVEKALNKLKTLWFTPTAEIRDKRYPVSNIKGEIFDKKDGKFKFTELPHFDRIFKTERFLVFCLVGISCRIKLGTIGNKNPNITLVIYYDYANDMYINSVISSLVGNPTYNGILKEVVKIDDTYELRDIPPMTKSAR